MQDLTKMMSMKTSILKLFRSFMMVYFFSSIWGFHLFKKYVAKYSVSEQVSINLFDIDVWPMVLIGSLPLPLAIIFPIFYFVPRTMNISEDGLSYKNGFSKTSESIVWNDVTKYQKTIWGFKLTLKDKELTIGLSWFKNDDKMKILKYVASSNK